MALTGFQFSQPLTEAVQGRVQNRDHFIFDKLGLLKAEAEAGTYKAMNRQVAQTSDAAARTAAAAATETDTQFDDKTFTLTEYSNAQFADKIRHGEMVPFDTLKAVGAGAAQKALYEAELNMAATFFTGGVWSADVDLSLTNEWSDKTNGNPIGDVETALTTMPTMLRPVLACAWDTYRALLSHPDIVNRLSNAGVIDAATNADLARILGVEAVVASRAQHYTGAAYALCVPAGEALLLDVPENPEMDMVQSSGSVVTFIPDGYPMDPLLLRQFESEERRATGVEAGVFIDCVANYADLGYRWHTAV